jgi:hypothetical protein
VFRECLGPIRRIVTVALTVVVVGTAACSSGSDAKVASTSTSTGVPKTTTAPSTTASTTTGSSPVTVAGSAVEADGTPIYGDPKVDVPTEDGKEFVIRLPAPTRSSAWVYDAKQCINAKLLGQTVAADGSTLVRFQWVVAGGCYLRFFDARSPEFSAAPDVQFNALDF